MLVWTGVTNNPIYKTDKIVMRRITAKDQTFTMGNSSYSDESPTHSVTLTNDYYLSVFEITQAQHYKLMKSYGSSMTSGTGHEFFPAMGKYSALWGRTENWPAGGRNVTMTKFLLALRNLANGAVAFDFPTEAQWEFACRAGTTGQWYTGSTSAGNTDRSRLGVAMGGTGTAPEKVGSYLPNAFGLYDMYSNAAEWCLDRYADYTADAVTDPVGPTSGDKRVIRGAHYSSIYSAKTHATTWRGGVTTGGGSNLYGCRLWCQAD